jgi:phosphopantothenoylcysteine decarboxylase/phosphopantothenate--cysteine ligase
MLKGKKILVGITGGIAAYKTPLLIRLLKKAGADVKVVPTPYALEFVTPLTLSVVSENPVHTEFYNSKDGTWNSHVELGLWADLIVVAPLTANTMAKMVNGITDNLLLATILSARCPVIVAPAMDMDMYQHLTTQENLKKIQTLGYKIIEPSEGELASGLSGKGRMKEPEEIYVEIKKIFSAEQEFSNKRVLVTAGPTHEPIDPVRFIGNNSSGLMGIEIAKSFARKGAKVDLILGPTHLPAEFPGITVHRVQTAQEMYERTTALFPKVDIAVLSAAVADFTPKQKADIKIKKETGLDSIELEPTKDILAQLGKMKKDHQLLIGFALETHDELQNAKSKLQRKNLDLIVMNSLNDQGAGFGVKTNKVTLIDKDENVESLPLMSKAEVAENLVNKIKRLI